MPRNKQRSAQLSQTFYSRNYNSAITASFTPDDGWALAVFQKLYSNLDFNLCSNLDSNFGLRFRLIFGLQFGLQCSSLKQQCSSSWLLYLSLPMEMVFSVLNFFTIKLPFVWENLLAVKWPNDTLMVKWRKHALFKIPTLPKLSWPPSLYNTFPISNTITSKVFLKADTLEENLLHFPLHPPQPQEVVFYLNNFFWKSG